MDRAPARADEPEVSAHWSPFLLIAAATFAASVVLAIGLIVGAACGGDNNLNPTPNRPVGTRSDQATATATPTQTPTSSPTSSATSQPTTPAATATTPGGANPTANATQGATDQSPLVACGLLAPLDKGHRIARDCVVGGLVSLPAAYANGDQQLTGDAASAFQRMADDAAAAGHEIVAVSAYRSYDTQVATYNYWVQTLGPEEAARTSALPGHSEHQLGTTLDISSATVGFELLESFGDTPEGRWLAQNAAKYGFVMSYPPGKEGVTGYAYEPWHFRYVGPSVAQAVAGSGQTLTEYLRR